MGMSIDVSQLNRLSVDLGKAPALVAGRAPVVVRKTAVGITRDGQAFAPVDTGNLRSSIGYKMTGPLEAEIGPTASYGHYVERGTSRMAPRAYMGPALDRNAPGFVEAMGQLAGEIL